MNKDKVTAIFQVLTNWSLEKQKNVNLKQKNLKSILPIIPSYNGKQKCIITKFTLRLPLGFRRNSFGAMAI